MSNNVYFFLGLLGNCNFVMLHKKRKMIFFVENIMIKETMEEDENECRNTSTFIKCGTVRAQY